MKLCPHCKKWDLSPRESKQIAQLQMMTPVTSRQVAERFGLVINNASNRLRKWEGAGFLSREEVTDPSGGIMHVYSIPKRPHQAKGD